MATPATAATLKAIKVLERPLLATWAAFSCCSTLATPTLDPPCPPYPEAPPSPLDPEDALLDPEVAPDPDPEDDPDEADPPEDPLEDEPDPDEESDPDEEVASDPDEDVPLLPSGFFLGGGCGVAVIISNEKPRLLYN